MNRLKYSILAGVMLILFLPVPGLLTMMSTTLTMENITVMKKGSQSL